MQFKLGTDITLSHLGINNLDRLNYLDEGCGLISEIDEATLFGCLSYKRYRRARNFIGDVY